MNKIKGIIEEVYIPVEENQDAMVSNKIGFKIKINNEILIYEEEQNESNSKIYKGNKVIIKKQIISGIEFISVEKLEGEEDE